MFRNMAGNLVVNERIETTEAKAKELRRIMERLISKAVRLGDDLTADLSTLSEEGRAAAVAKRVHAQRLVASFIPKQLEKTLPGGDQESVDVVYKLFHEVAPFYLSRVREGKAGGYTRIVKLPPRKGDHARMALVELVGFEKVYSARSSGSTESVSEEAAA